MIGLFPGEFNMWADLIAGLTVTGVKVTVVSTLVDFWLLVQNQHTPYDMVITDYGKRAISFTLPSM